MAAFPSASEEATLGFLMITEAGWEAVQADILAFAEEGPREVDHDGCD